MPTRQPTPPAPLPAGACPEPGQRVSGQVRRAVDPSVGEEKLPEDVRPGNLASPKTEPAWIESNARDPKQPLHPSTRLCKVGIQQVVAGTFT